jgi:hypothetical protein
MCVYVIMLVPFNNCFDFYESPVGKKYSTLKLQLLLLLQLTSYSMVRKLLNDVCFLVYLTTLPLHRVEWEDDCE